MLNVVTRSVVISRSFCSLLSKTLKQKHIVRRSNKFSVHDGGYINDNSTCLLKRYSRISSRLSAKVFSSQYSTGHELSSVRYEKICDETLESLAEYFEELVEATAHLADADVSYGDGVLTVKFGDPHGTYVINRQTPNKQIWLSSPKSGPKRYDFVNGQWVYKHDGKSLHEILDNEIPAIIRNQTCFNKCSFSGREKQAVIDSLSTEK